MTVHKKHIGTNQPKCGCDVCIHHTLMSLLKSQNTDTNAMVTALALFVLHTDEIKTIKFSHDMRFPTMWHFDMC